MLLDEPLRFITKTYSEIFEIIIRINQELKTTILVEQNANIALSNSHLDMF